MRAVGTRRSEVVRLVLGEALGSMRLSIPWGEIATAAAVCLLLAPLAGLVAARLDVVAALRHEEPGMSLGPLPLAGAPM